MLVERNGKNYWYTYTREGNRVRRVYVGSGPVAELAALEAQEQLARQQEARRQVQQERDRQAQVDALVDELITQTNHQVHAALEAAGYHRHRRGNWRKRRYVPDDQSNPVRADAALQGAGSAGDQSPGANASQRRPA